MCKASKYISLILCIYCVVTSMNAGENRNTKQHKEYIYKIVEQVNSYSLEQKRIVAACVNATSITTSKAYDWGASRALTLKLLETDDETLRLEIFYFRPLRPFDYRELMTYTKTDIERHILAEGWLAALRNFDIGEPLGISPYLSNEANQVMKSNICPLAEKYFSAGYETRAYIVCHGRSLPTDYKDIDERIIGKARWENMKKYMYYGQCGWPKDYIDKLFPNTTD